MNTQAFDPHSVLGVAHTATPEEITAAYRSLAQVEHPDKGGSTSRMADINRAFELLSERSPAVAAAQTEDLLLRRLKLEIAFKSRHDLHVLRKEVAGHARLYGPDWVIRLKYLDRLLALSPAAFEAEHEACRELLMETVGPLIEANASDHAIKNATQFIDAQIHFARAMFQGRRAQ